jgi:hypothetical protein
MHSRHYLLDDHPRDGATLGWAYCMRRKKGEACGCAESLALLGLWAALADMRPSSGNSSGQGVGGFTVDRAWDKIPGERDDLDLEGFSDDEEEDKGKGANRKWENGKGNAALRGELKFYRDLTK